MINHPEQLDDLDHRLTRALETAPVFTLPEGFAARTASAASRLPTPSAVPQLSRRFSTLTIQFAFAALILAMLIFAPWIASQPRAHSLLLLLTEIAFAIELVALTTWQTLRPQQ
jgi:hypothetical protein